MAKLSFPTNPI